MAMTPDLKARRYAIISGKGGVGKSVIAANLGAGLAATGRRTLVIDADLGLANLDVILGLYPSHTLHDVLCGTCNVDDALVRARGGFDLLPAGSGLQDDAALTAPMADELEAMLQKLDLRYEAILFDAGAGIGDLVMFFARMADEILLVVTPEATSLMDAYATIKILSQKYGRPNFSLVVNRANPANPLQTGNAVTAHLQRVATKFLAARGSGAVTVRLAGCVPNDPAVARALSHQCLLADLDPKAPSAMSLARLAERVCSSA
jgi:flagellar biosynthesis protein FlhG